jgi:hypothetical protein
MGRNQAVAKRLCAVNVHADLADVATEITPSTLVARSVARPGREWTLAEHDDAARCMASHDQRVQT